jgi:hypothetical protein
VSVPETQRTHGKLEVLTKAMDLAVYTLRITKNPKVFPPEYQSSMTDDIIRTAKDIYIDAWTANNISVRSADDWKERKYLQERAARNCNNFLALIQLAKPLYHLSSKRIAYWGKLIIEVRNLIRKWKDSDSKRYGNLK